MLTDIIHTVSMVPIEIRYNFNDETEVKSVVILSSGYGNDGFEELAQLAIIDLLDKKGISWVQYIYPERSSLSPIDDLYISTGVATLSCVYEWVRVTTDAPITLYGYSFGGNISIELALKYEIESLLLVNCVFDYVDYRKRQIGKEAYYQWGKSKLTFLSYGEATFSLGYRFIFEATTQDLVDRISSIDTPIFAMQSEYDANISLDHIKSLAEKNNNFQAFTISGKHADHSLEHPKALDKFITIVNPIIETLWN